MNDDSVKQYVDSLVPPDDDPNAQAARRAAEAAAAAEPGIGRMFAAMAISMVPGGGMAQMGGSMGQVAGAMGGAVPPPQ